MSAPGTNINLADKVADKIKKSEWGDFISEEDVYGLVKTALENVFFKPTTVVQNAGRYDSKTITIPPVVETVVKEAFEKVVKLQAEKWFTENQDKLLEKWQAVFDQGIFTYAMRLQQEMITAHLRNTINSSINQYNRDLRPNPDGSNPNYMPCV